MTPRRHVQSQFMGGGLTPLPVSDPPSLQSRQSTGLPRVYAAGMESKDTESHFDGGSMQLSDRAPAGCSFDGVLSPSQAQHYAKLNSTLFTSSMAIAAPHGAAPARAEPARRPSSPLPQVYRHFEAAGDDSADHFEGASMILAADEAPTAPLEAEAIEEWKGQLASAGAIKAAGTASSIADLATRQWHAAGHSERHKLIGLGGREWRASAARIDTSGIANGHTTPPNGHHR